MAVCKECRAIFTPSDLSRSGLCPECVLQEDEDFEVVKEYIATNPRSNMLDIVRETDVPLRTVDKLIRSGRLHMNR